MKRERRPIGQWMARLESLHRKLDKQSAIMSPSIIAAEISAQHSSLYYNHRCNLGWRGIQIKNLGSTGRTIQRIMVCINEKPSSIRFFRCPRNSLLVLLKPLVGLNSMLTEYQSLSSWYVSHTINHRKLTQSIGLWAATLQYSRIYRYYWRLLFILFRFLVPWVQLFPFA